MNERKNLTIMDYFALYQMSLRSFFWRVDGRLNITARRSRQSGVA